MLKNHFAIFANKKCISVKMHAVSYAVSNAHSKDYNIQKGNKDFKSTKI